MNNPTSTIQEFANRLVDLSCVTPIFTHRPAIASTKLSNPPSDLRSPTTLHALVSTITTGLAESQLPLDPTLPLLQTPDTTPLKSFRPRSSTSSLLPPAEAINKTNCFPAFLSAQVEHLQRVSHYNYNVLELTPTKSITHPANKFCDNLISLIPNRETFKARFGVYPTSSHAIALISALKTAREAVVPIGETFFIHYRGGGEKLKISNDAAIKRIILNICFANGTWYRRFRMASILAWAVILVWCALVTAVGIWNSDGRSIIQALLDSANVLQLGIVFAILALGVGKEFWGRFGLLVGWRAWSHEKDIVRDVGKSGRDALMAGLLSGNLVDELVHGFGIGEGDIRLREWMYDPRFGIFVGEKNAFCVRGRRWYRVEKVYETPTDGEKKGKKFRYRLFLTGVKKAFVAVGAGVVVTDGGKGREIV